MYSYGPPHLAGQKQDDQLEHTYSSCVRIRDVALKTCQRRWTIGRSGERGSEISVLAARHDDYDDMIYNFVHNLLMKLVRNLIINVPLGIKRPKAACHAIKINQWINTFYAISHLNVCDILCHVPHSRHFSTQNFSSANVITFIFIQLIRWERDVTMLIFKTE